MACNPLWGPYGSSHRGAVVGLGPCTHMFWSRGRPGAPWDWGREKATPNFLQTPSCPKGPDGFTLPRLGGEGHLLWIAHPYWGVETPMGVFPQIPSGREQKLAPGGDVLKLAILGPKKGPQNCNFIFGVPSLGLRHLCRITVVALWRYHNYFAYLCVAGGMRAPRESQHTWVMRGR